MLICRSCGSSFTGNFCSNCGTPAAPNSSLRCPRCNSESASNMAFCANCGTALQPSQYAVQGPQYPSAPPAPYPNQPVPQKQNNIGKYLMGALGGAAAVIGGEILMHDVEKGIERHVEKDVERREWMMGEPPHHHHHHHEHHHHHRRCACGHEFSIDIDICPRCRKRWGHW